MSNSASDDRRVVHRSRMRLEIARRMAQSKRDIPHFYTSVEVVTDRAAALVRSLRQAGAPVTLTAVLLRALVETLSEHPAFNAHVTDEGHVIIDRINVGVAIEVDDGLIAPALLDCADLDHAILAERLADLVARAHAGKLRGPELVAPTFTLSNLGMHDVRSFIAIIPPPQVAILATGRAAAHPVVEPDGRIVVRSVMTATLSADHRAVDGAAAARFVASFKARVESIGLPPDQRPPSG